MPKDWEEQMLKQMEEMFRSMGMNIDIEQLRSLMEQFRGQFESMGLDSERLEKGDVNFNFDMSKLMKMFQSGMSPEDMMSNLGVDVKVDAAPAVIDIEDDEVSNEMLKLPADDIYLSGWNMSVTVDISTKVVDQEIEIALSSGGEVIQLLSNPSEPPLVQIELPHQCDDVVEWSINNGILDVTLKLAPQGSAIEPTSKDLDEKIEDDYSPIASDVSVDLSDDDDDDDDGGIPIL